MDIKDILMCPECKLPLDDGLECAGCRHTYQLKYGVYDIVSQKLSGDQKILWRITDEMIEAEEPSVNNSNSASQKAEVKDYQSRKSDETKQAELKQYVFMNKLISSLSGVVCDLATGRGGNLQHLLNSGAKDIYIVCTDIDRRVLAMTRKNKKTDDSRIFYIATDGRYMSIKDGSIDYITSVAAFGNIPESDKVAGELYRTLKPGGKLIIRGTYIEKGSKSFELAKSMGLEKGMVEEYLIYELEKAGFKNIESIVVGKAVWAKNPYDILPVAGDMQHFCVIQAVK